jgi:hypothetical protein
LTDPTEIEQAIASAKSSRLHRGASASTLKAQGVPVKYDAEGRRVGLDRRLHHAEGRPGKEENATTTSMPAAPETGMDDRDYGYAHSTAGVRHGEPGAFARSAFLARCILRPGVPAGDGSGDAAKYVEMFEAVKAGQ